MPLDTHSSTRLTEPLVGYTPTATPSNPPETLPETQSIHSPPPETQLANPTHLPDTSPIQPTSPLPSLELPANPNPSITTPPMPRRLPMPTHPMTTRAKDDIFKLKLYSSVIPFDEPPLTEPTTYKQAS
nr:hypothetical protein Itr_chr13CG11760 [Ipomoea trifida]